MSGDPNATYRKSLIGEAVDESETSYEEDSTQTLEDRDIADGGNSSIDLRATSLLTPPSSTSVEHDENINSNVDISLANVNLTRNAPCDHSEHSHNSVCDTDRGIRPIQPEELNDQVRIIEEQQKRIEELITTVARKNEEIERQNTLALSIKDLENYASSLEIRLRAAEVGRKNDEEKLEHAEKELQQCSIQIDTLKNQIIQKDETIRRFKDENDKLKEHNRQKDETIDQLRGNLSTPRSNINETVFEHVGSIQHPSGKQHPPGELQRSHSMPMVQQHGRFQITRHYSSGESRDVVQQTYEHQEAVCDIQGTPPGSVTSPVGYIQGTPPDSVTSPMSKRMRFSFGPSNVLQCKACKRVFQNRNEALSTPCSFHKMEPQPYSVWNRFLKEEDQSQHDCKYWTCCQQKSKTTPPGCVSLKNHDIDYPGNDDNGGVD